MQIATGGTALAGERGGRGFGRSGDRGLGLELAQLHAHLATAGE